MMQKKVVFLCSEAPANANAIQTIKAQRKIAEFKTLTKSFFGWTVQIIRMKSTIAMVFNLTLIELKKEVSYEIFWN